MRMSLLLAIMLGLSACGSNLYKPAAGKSEAYYLEEARILLDKDDYAGASDALDQVATHDTQWVLLKVSTYLGPQGLGLWDLILQLTDTKNLGDQAGGGADRILNALDESFFGEGAVRQAKTEAMNNSITLLKSTEQTSTVSNLRCLLGSFLILPVVTSAQSTIEDILSSLQTIADSAVSGGSSAGSCPGVGDFSSSLSNATGLLSSLSTAKDEYGSCKIFQAATSSGSLNQIQEKIDRLFDNADKGCLSINCTLGGNLCNAIQLPCVNDLLNADGAVAGDGQIAVCELIQNCGGNTSCFQ
jgi:hypothetical protein